MFMTEDSRSEKLNRDCHDWSDMMQDSQMVELQFLTAYKVLYSARLQRSTRVGHSSTRHHMQAKVRKMMDEARQRLI